MFNLYQAEKVARERLENEHKQLQQASRQLISEMKREMSEYDECKERLEQAERQAVQLRQVVNGVQAQHERAVAHTRMLEATVRSLQKEREQVHEQCGMLKEVNAQLEQRLESQSEVLQTKQDAIARLEEVVEQREAEVEATAKKEEHWKARARELESKLRVVSKSNKQRQARIATLLTEKTRLQRRIAALDSENAQDARRSENMRMNTSPQPNTPSPLKRMKKREMERTVAEQAELIKALQRDVAKLQAENHTLVVRFRNATT